MRVVKLEIELGRARLARAWVRACVIATPVLGATLAVKVGHRDAMRILSWRLVGSKQWNRMAS